MVFPGGSELFVLNPITEGEIADSNDNSMVAKLTYKDLSILFCADISTKVMDRLNHYGDFLISDIIKIPHHGGSVEEKDIFRHFLELVSPRFAVISVGRINRYRAPSKGTLDAIDSLSIKEYETKNCGAIMVIGDGKSFEVKTTVRNKSL